LLADDIELIGVEAGGTGDGLGQNAATLATGTAGVLQGCYSLILQNDDGQVQETHSISAGLDYSGVGPEHALLQAVDRVTYVTASDDEALAAVEELCERAY
jgi:tryptophan synthase beta chain